MVSFCAEFLRSTTIQPLKMVAVCCWALAEWSYLVETSGTWMDDHTALRAVQLAKLYLQTHMLMARRSLLSGQPRWKIRPRMHSFACEITARMENGSRMSPREAACWGDESWIGRTCHVGLAPAVHTSTLRLRILQRVLMHVNAELANLPHRE